MNIAIDVSSTAGFRTGTEEYIEGLVYGLNRVGCQVVGVGRESQALLPDKPRLGFEVREHPTPYQKWWWENYGIRRIPKDIDLIHIPFMAHPSRRLQVPSVITVHDLIPYRLQEYRKSVKERVYFSHIAKALPWADRLVAISQATQADLAEFFPGLIEKTVVIPNGVHPAFFFEIDIEGTSTVTRRFGIKRSPRILYAGGYDERKNVETLLLAMKDVFHGRRDGELVLVGAKDHLAVRRRVSEYGLESRVMVTPYVSRMELVALYTTADLFVYPSRYEGFGMPPAQALAVGVPVVASDIPSVREVVGDCGLLVNPDSVADWTHAITSSLDSPVQTQKMVERGRVRARDFSWTEIARQYVQVYQDALHGRR